MRRSGNRLTVGTSSWFLLALLTLNFSVCLAENLPAQRNTSPTTLSSFLFEANELAYDVVTVFSDRAEVQRRIEVTLDGAGEHEITVRNLSDPYISFNSLSVQVLDNVQVILSKVTQEDKQVQIKGAEDRWKSIAQEVHVLEQSIAKHKAALERVEAQLKFIQNYGRDLTSFSSRQTVPPPSVDDLDKFVTFYATKATALDEERLQETNFINTLEEQLVDKQNAQYSAQLAVTGNIKNVIIGLNNKASGPVKVTLILRYITMAATWAPSYTVEVDSVNKKAQLHFYAHVNQWTDVAWTNVNLRLSTANATISAVPPKMTPVYLSFDSGNLNNYGTGIYRKQRSNQYQSNIYQSSMSNAYTADNRKYSQLEGSSLGAFFEDEVEEQADEVVEDLENLFDKKLHEDAFLETSAVSSVYSLVRPVTVPSRGVTELHVVTITLEDLEFKHHALPRLSPSAYLRAKAENTSPYTLLPGRLTVYMDNNFVTTKSRLDRVVNPQQEFEIFLGTDSSVRVEYKPMKKFQETEGMILTSSVVQTVDTFNVISNNKQTPINITIYDQVPISTNEDIVVEVLKPSAVNLKDERQNQKMTVQLHKETKFIRWTGTIDAAEVLSLPVKYKIIHPPGRAVGETR